MNREEFIKKQLKKYGCFNDVNTPIWKEDYEKVLQEPNIDYDKLDLKIIYEWDGTFNAPDTKWIRIAKVDCIPKDDRCETLKRIDEIKSNSAPPPPEVTERIKALKEKMLKQKMAG